MGNHDTTDWVEKYFVPFTCTKGHTCKDCPESKGCFFEQKRGGGKLMKKCSCCSKPISNGATITVEKPVYNKLFNHSSVERFYTLCGYCTEELEEFLSRKEEESNE